MNMFKLQIWLQIMCMMIKYTEQSVHHFSSSLRIAPDSVKDSIEKSHTEGEAMISNSNILGVSEWWYF